MHTRAFFSLFFISLSLTALFPGSSSLAPFSSAFALSLFHVLVLRNTHATSMLERARALHPLHRDVLSKIQPFFSRADQWALQLPLYPPVPPLAFFIIRHSASSKFHSFPFTLSSREQSLRAPLPAHSRRCSLRTRGSPRWSSAASLGFPSRCSYPPPSSLSSHNIPADITAFFQFRPNLPECCQFSSTVVVHNITFTVLKGSRYP